MLGNLGGYSIFLFWVGLAFLILGFIFKKRKSGKTLHMISYTVFFLAFLFFMWWAVLRMVQ